MALRLLPALSVLALAGCKSAAELTGLAVGAAAGGASVNPAVGYAVAVGTASAADYGFKYAVRVRQHAEQEAIARAAGTLPPYGMAPWRIEHDIPVGDEHGEVRLVRTIDTPLATCREIMFSVLDGPRTPAAWFDASICRRGESWHWASAEPAVERWGFLQ